MKELQYIEDNLRELEFNINEACVRSNRIRSDVILLPVTKNQGTDKILALYNLGCRCFGENRVQELLFKKESLPFDIDWHLIGSLQSNKVKNIIGKVSMIHSLDSISLMKEINKRSAGSDLITDCLVEVNITKEASKSGLFAEDLAEFLKQAENYNNIRIKGLMAIGPNTDDKEHIKSLFRLMESKFVDMGCKKMHNVYMKYLSMGMSGDYTEAIECGANILRIGTSIFGPRG